MEPPLCTNGSAGYLLQLSVKGTCRVVFGQVPIRVANSDLHLKQDKNYCY